MDHFLNDLLLRCHSRLKLKFKSYVIFIILFTLRDWIVLSEVSRVLLTALNTCVKFESPSNIPRGQSSSISGMETNE